MADHNLITVLLNLMEKFIRSFRRWHRLLYLRYKIPANTLRCRSHPHSDSHSFLLGTNNRSWTYFPQASPPKARTGLSYSNWTEKLKLYHLARRPHWRLCRFLLSDWHRCLLGVPKTVNSTFFSGAPCVVRTVHLWGSQALTWLPTKNRVTYTLGVIIRDLQVFYAIRKDGTKFFLDFHWSDQWHYLDPGGIQISLNSLDRAFTDTQLPYSFSSSFLSWD